MKKGNFSLIKKIDLSDDTVYNYHISEPIEGLLLSKNMAGRLTATDKEKGVKIWAIDGKYMHPTSHDGLIYAGEYNDSGFVAIDPKTGKKRWHVQLPKSLDTFSSPILFDDENRIALFHSNKAVFAIHLDKKKVSWKTTIVGNFLRCPLYIHKGQVIVQTIGQTGGTLNFLDLKTGEIKNEILLEYAIANFLEGCIDENDTFYYVAARPKSNYSKGERLCSINLVTEMQKNLMHNPCGLEKQLTSHRFANPHFCNGKIYIYHEIDGDCNFKHCGLYRFDADTLKEEALLIPNPTVMASTLMYGNIVYMLTSGTECESTGEKHAQYLYAVNPKDGTIETMEIPTAKWVDEESLSVEGNEVLLATTDEEDKQEILIIEIPENLRK